MDDGTTEQLVKIKLDQAATLVREAGRLLPRRPDPGSPAAVVAWRCNDVLTRLKLAREAWDPQANIFGGESE